MRERERERERDCGEREIVAGEREKSVRVISGRVH